jgi:hypothetical protein
MITNKQLNQLKAINTILDSGMINYKQYDVILVRY